MTPGARLLHRSRTASPRPDTSDWRPGSEVGDSSATPVNRRDELHHLWITSRNLPLRRTQEDLETNGLWIDFTDPRDRPTQIAALQGNQGHERHRRGSGGGTLRRSGQGGAAAELFKVSLLDQGGPLRGPRALAAEGRRRSCLPPRSRQPPAAQRARTASVPTEPRKQPDQPEAAPPGRHHGSTRHSHHDQTHAASSPGHVEFAVTHRSSRANPNRAAWPGRRGRG